MIYDFFRCIGIISGYPIQWILFKKKVYYENEKQPVRFTKGGALIISNHFSPFDYVGNVFLAFPRKLYVVASELAFNSPLIRFGMKFWGGIEANRKTKSMRFVDTCAQKLKEGCMVQIFPEGHNTPDGSIKPFFPSYVLIALKGDAPIIPVVTDGKYGMFKRNRVIVGEKIYPKQYLDSDSYTNADVYRINGIIYNKVLELREELEKRH